MLILTATNLWHERKWLSPLLSLLVASAILISPCAFPASPSHPPPPQQNTTISQLWTSSELDGVCLIESKYWLGLLGPRLWSKLHSLSLSELQIAWVALRSSRTQTLYVSSFLFDGTEKFSLPGEYSQLSSQRKGNCRNKRRAPNKLCRRGLAETVQTSASAVKSLRAWPPTLGTFHTETGMTKVHYCLKQGCEAEGKPPQQSVGNIFPLRRTLAPKTGTQRTGHFHGRGLAPLRLSIGMRCGRGVSGCWRA